MDSYLFWSENLRIVWSPYCCPSTGNARPPSETNDPPYQAPHPQGLPGHSARPLLHCDLLPIHRARQAVLLRQSRLMLRHTLLPVHRDCQTVERCWRRRQASSFLKTMLVIAAGELQHLLIYKMGEIITPTHCEGVSQDQPYPSSSIDLVARQLVVLPYLPNDREEGSYFNL